ncbi:AAA+ ATPase domain-containing protein [Tanacetum coccineum]
MIHKQIDEAKVRQLKMMNLAVEYDNACTAQDDLRKAYEESMTYHKRNKVVEDEGEDDDFKSGSWVSATNYMNANGGTSCSPNVLGELTVTMKDLAGTIHHKVIGEGGYGNDITVGVALIIANVSFFFSPKPSLHYFNITKKNVVKVFRKDTVSGSDSG